MAARPRSTSESIQPKAAVGQASTLRYAINATMSATNKSPRMTRMPPYQMTINTVSPLMPCITGFTMPRILRHVHAFDLELFVQTDKLLGLKFLLRVGLDHVHAAQVFLHVAAQNRHLLLHFQRAFHNSAAKLARHDRSTTETAPERRKVMRTSIDSISATRIDVVKRRIDEIEHAGAEHHPHRGDVVDHPRHQIAGSL